jgi:hypothetical protein
MVQTQSIIHMHDDTGRSTLPDKDAYPPSPSGSVKGVYGNIYLAIGLYRVGSMLVPNPSTVTSHSFEKIVTQSL